MSNSDADSQSASYVENTLNFTEANLSTYDESVQQYFSEAVRMPVRELKDLAAENEVTKTIGDLGRWTRPPIIRDLMASGVALPSGKVVESAVVSRDWLPIDNGDDEDSGDDHRSESSLDKGDIMDKELRDEIRGGNPMRRAPGVDMPPSPPSELSKPMRDYLKSVQAQVQKLQQTIETQQLEIVRIRSNKEVRREYGIGLSPVLLLQESKALLWSATANPFEQAPLKSVEYLDLMRENSSDDLSSLLHLRPGIGESEAVYCNKTKEFSVKDVFDKHTRPMIQRLEPVVTTLLTAHTCAIHVMDCAEFLSGSDIQFLDSAGKACSHTLPAPVLDRIRQMEVDAELTVNRIAASISLVQSETARLCSETSMAVAKKMSAGAAQQLQLSKQDAQSKTASMLTDTFVKVLEEHRKKDKTLNHALSASTKPKGQSKYGRPRGGRSGNGKGGNNGRPKKTNNSTNNNKQPPKKKPTSPAAATSPHAGKGATRRD